MSNSDTTPVWKKLYHVISGSNTTVTEDIVEEILGACKDKLVKGFLEFTPYTKKSFQSWKQQSGLRVIVEDDEMCNFVHLLSKDLDLDCNVAWTVMCNFLMFEYFGKIDELKSIVRYDSNVRCLIEHVWYFYSADRMFLLKSLRHIFEHLPNKEYKFYKQFDAFIKSIDMKVLWKNLYKTLDNLITEIDYDKAHVVSSDIFKRWIHRNNREQVEVVTLLTHTIQFCKLDGKELEEVLTLFLKHGFTRHLLYQPANTESNPKDLWDIKCAEIGCVLSVMGQYWKSPGTAKILPKSVERNLELLQIQGDNSIVLFAWAVLKTSVYESEDSLEYCNTITSELVEKKVFQSLHNILINRIFEKCRSGDIVMDGIFRLMSGFVRICVDCTYLHEQDGVCYVTAELLKRKGLVVLDNLGPIFQLSMDAFPFVFNPFLEMCKSLLAIPEQYDKIMQLLKSIPSFLSEIPWNDHRDQFSLVNSQKLFINTDEFIIPAGTIIEKFNYQGMEFARFLYPFSFFSLLEHFTKSLSIITFEVGKSWYCYDNLTELVHIGFKFIIHILKHYKGDFKKDVDIKRLVQRLEIVPSQFCDGPMKNINLIKLFFETNVTLITQNMLSFSEAFSPIIRRKFFPQNSSYNRTNKQLLIQMHYESILFRSLKEEETSRDHSLLVEYLKLIKYTVENNICHSEVQTAGLWYLLNIAFPLHQQWLYEDDYQKLTICKLCLMVFIKVLQNREGGEESKSHEIFTMCRDTFLSEELLMSSYLTIFYKEKFYIQNLMQQESNWMNGPILEQVENIKLQMVFLLLLYKIRLGLPSTIKCTVDNKINVITKAISAHMVNPYNASLRILSYRFLEILARDENTPMMALLGLDYDQVQRLFLDQLRDPMEDDNVKMQILELISTCISSQHGMTAALFNVKRSRKWHSDNKEKCIEGDTVTDFMIDYLQNIKKSSEYLKSPLQVAILRVMSNLWLNQKKHLIKDIIALDAFWPLLLDPLLQEYNHSSAVYAHIFKILAIQLGDPANNQKQFYATIEKFLTDEKLMDKWQKYMVENLSNSQLHPSNIHEKEQLLRSWIEFIVMVEKEVKLKITSDKTKFLFIEMCLDCIQFTFANTHCLDTWMNMCLIFIMKWGIHFKGKEADIVKKVTKMFSIIKIRYQDLNTQTRSTILTIMLTILNSFKDYFDSNSAELLLLLDEIGFLVDFEYKTLEDEVWLRVAEGTIATRELMIPWMMCVFISNKILKMKNVTEFSLWFSYRNYLQKIIKCTSDLLNIQQARPLAKITLHSLQLYVESPLAFDFFNVNMTSFYDTIERSFTTLFLGKSNKINFQELEDCWVTYTVLMKFNQSFLKKFQYNALPTCYTYITLHEQIIQQIMLIPESTVAFKGLNLLLNTLTFFDYVITNWKTEWYKKSSATYSFILKCVEKLVNSSLYIILRPKNIVVYNLHDYHKLTQLEVPMSLIVIIMNKLITVTGLCFSMLYQVNPNLISLMGVTSDDSMKVLLQNDFSVPKFELPIPHELTYGKLLCLAHFMCKTLDALSNTTQSEFVDEDKFSTCIGFVEHQDSGHNLPNQKLGAYLRYAMYEYSGLADPWIRKLDQRPVKKSFELLMTFLSQQVYIFVQKADTQTLPYFKRNLASELQFFYEHVKKHVSMSFIDQVPTQMRSSSTYKVDLDVINRYLMYCRSNNKFNDAADNNFGIAIMHWFTKICQVY